MRTYGTICECGNIRKTTEQMCPDCMAIENKNKENRIRNTTADEIYNDQERLDK